MTRNWDDLKYLLAVAEAGTLSTAASALNSNATTVARRVRRLEDEIGFPLIERAGEGWRPTPGAAPLVETARQIRAAMGTAETAIAHDTSTLKGKLAINSTPFVITQVLARRSWEFIARHPEVKLDINFIARPQSLAQGEADLALRITQPSEGRLVRRKLASFDVGIYKRRGTSAAGEHWLGLTESMDSNAVMEVGHRALGSKPTVRLHSLNNLALAMVGSGLPGPLPSCVARAHPELEPMRPDPGSEEKALWAVYHESKRADPRVEAAMTWLKELFPNPKQCVCGACA